MGRDRLVIGWGCPGREGGSSPSTTRSPWGARLRPPGPPWEHHRTRGRRRPVARSVSITNLARSVPGCRNLLAARKGASCRALRRHLFPGRCSFLATFFPAGSRGCAPPGTVARNPFRSGEPWSSVEEELDFHVEQKVEDLVASGWDREDALREAKRRFGDRRYWTRRTAKESRRRRRTRPVASRWTPSSTI